MYFGDFDVFGGFEMVILDDFHLFCCVCATPSNRASEAFRDESSCANSGGSHLLIMLAYFEDLDVSGPI